MNHAAPSPRVYSPYQEAIFRAFTEGSGNVVVEAVAGSGKTTTLVEALKRWQQVEANRGKRALFCAFNKSIADELSRRVPTGVDAKTLHGLSFGAVIRRFKGIKVNDRKLHDTAKALATAVLGDKDRERLQEVSGDLAKVYGLLRGTMTQLSDSDAVADTISSYGATLDAPADSLPLISELDQIMRSETSSCTFDEMLTFVIDHSIPMPKYDLICVDESQDLNRLQIELLKRALAPSGRLVAVGDSKQACYLFRGADARAMERIREEFNVSQGNCLPLSITYRCPRTVVEFAQQWVPHIQAADSAAVGEVVRRTAEEVNDTLMGLPHEAMVICRVNAPLVGTALAMIARGRKAVVRGRDIGKTIAKLATKLSQKVAKHKMVGRNRVSADEMEGLEAEVKEYRDTEGAKLIKARKDTQAQQLDDQCETLLALMSGVVSIQALHSRIEQLFSDDRVGVVFSSIHRSKGLEAKTVVWLAPEKNDAMEERARSDSAAAQESNLRYIAVTRAIEMLIVQPLPEKEG